MTANQRPYEATGYSSTVGNVTLTEYLESDLSTPTEAQAASADPKVARATPAQAEADLAAGHVDPAAAARWRQAQTEMVGLILGEGRTLSQDPAAERVLPDRLGDWMEKRVAELEQAEADEPEIEAIG